jgi:Xaa-Pro aminopeptidase
MPPRSSAWRRPPRRRAYEEILQVRFAGRRETEVAADLAGLLRRFGHSQGGLPVVGSGPNGANPHHEIGERVIEDGDMVVLDFGGLKYGYGSDTTRTVHVGEATDEEREVHEIVCRAQQAAFDAVRPGMCFSVEPGIYLSGRFGSGSRTSSPSRPTAVDADSTRPRTRCRSSARPRTARPTPSHALSWASTARCTLP